MKERDKINVLKFLHKFIEYKDGFWVLNNELVSEQRIRDFIVQQGFEILQKDITDILSELSYTTSNFDVPLPLLTVYLNAQPHIQ